MWDLIITTIILIQFIFIPVDICFKSVRNTEFFITSNFSNYK